MLAARSEAMERGHQERLAPLVRGLAGEAGIAFRQIERIGVTVGPGSFTGLRVGLAFAKGMALALAKPVAGVGTLHALATTGGRDGLVAAAIDARREQVYLQAFQDGEALGEADAVAVAEAAARLRALGARGRLTLVGSGAPLLAAAFPEARQLDVTAPDPLVVARLAADSELPARPFYLRAPDAKLPT